MQQLMRAAFAASLVSLGACLRGMQGGPMTPVSKATELLVDMQAKITADGEAAKKTQAEKAEACKLEARDLGFSIETSNSEIEASKAQIAKASSTITALREEIEELTATVASNEASLADATKIRENETATFNEAEKELLELIDTLQRATAILTREMQKGGEFLQGPATTSVVQALESLVQGSALSTDDVSSLSALIQRGKADADDSAFGAPDAAVYAGHSDDIIEVLEKLLDQAQAQLADARKAEMTSQHNFALTEQSLQMEMKEANARLAGAKKELVATAKDKDTATDELAASSETLASDEATLKTLNEGCDEGQECFEAASASRDEELKAIAAALEALSTIGAAEERQYGASFLQRSQLSSASGLAGQEVTRLLRDLARKQGAPELAQLASRVSSVMQQGAGVGDDPFAKVKGLISDLLKKLMEEADAEASAKEKCDEDLADQRAKKEEQTSTVEQLTATIDSKTAMSSKLKEEVEALTESLSELLEAQDKMDTVRKEEHAEYKQAVSDMELGLQGVELALKALSEYYAKEGKSHTASEDAASGVIGMLEVVKSDFTLDLAKMEETESLSQSDYESLSKANALEKVSKEKDVEYKTKESAALEKAVADASTDRTDMQEELDATNEYLEAREKQCADKVETYGERKERREAEIAGLKEALSILESEVALVQQRTRRAKRSLRLEPSMK